MKLKALGAVAAVAVVVVFGARFAAAFLNGVIINKSYAVSQIIPIALGPGGNSNVSAVVTYSSPTFSNATFTSGQVSTGSITIANNTKMSTAAATESIVLTSTSGAIGDFVSMSCPVPPGAVVARVNRDWIYGGTKHTAAVNLAAALTHLGACLGGVHFVASGSVVYATAPVGGLYNNISVVTNNPTTITVSSPTFLGGRNSAVVSVNGTPFKANLNFTVGVSSAATATNLATAINAKTPLNTWLKATAGSGATAGVVALQSKLAGAVYNFPLATSNNAAATVFAPRLYGGATPAYAVGGTVITVPAHGFVTGLEVLFSSGTHGSVIGGLANHTDYYVGVVDANNLSLASSRDNAAAGTFITLTSSNTLTVADTYTLAPVAFSAGSAGFSWDVSNDGTNWTPLNVSSLTYTGAGTEAWSFGAIPFAYLGLDFVAPNAGAIKLQVNAQGSAN